MYSKDITRRIANLKLGSAFTASDFFDIARSDCVNQTLNRLAKSGQILRIRHGIYDKPEWSPLLKDYAAPQIDQIAQAFARKFNWEIAPDGDTALNLLGLSTQVPNRWLFVSSGPYRSYEFDGIALDFKHSALREISRMHPQSQLVIQALRALGKTNLTEKNLRALKKQLTSKEAENLIKESRSASAWIARAVREMDSLEENRCSIPKKEGEGPKNL